MQRTSKCLSLAALAFAVTTAYGHALWINVVPHAQEHVIVSLGYGDTLPGSELLSTEWGPMAVKSYDLVAPDGTRASLEPPVIATPARKALSAGISLQAAGDTGIRKLAFSPATTKGTYQVVAETPVTRYTKYRDRAGAERYSDLPPREIKNLAEILDHSFDLMYMKAAFSVGGWSEPRPVGQLFEIVPLTNLDEAKVGDIVRFKVLFDGQAWTPSGQSPQLTAHNAALGDSWGVFVPLSSGEGAFRLSHAGLWKLTATFSAAVGSDPRYARLAPGAANDTPIYFDSTFVMNVKP